MNEGEETQKVYDYSKGGYFGELALIRNEPRAANVIAKVSNLKYCNIVIFEIL